MKKSKLYTGLIASVIAASIAAVPVYADTEDDAPDTSVSQTDAGDNAAVNEKNSNNVSNPNTGAVTLASVSVVLAGAAIVVSKKKQ